MFLFDRIAQHVVSAELLREDPESGCQVVSVTYEPHLHGHSASSTSPLVFWLHAQTHLVWRVEGEVTHRMPAEDETRLHKIKIVFTRIVANEPIAPETFAFTPPPDALIESPPTGPGGRIGGSGGGGSRRQDPKTGNWIESSHSQDTDGESIIQRDKLRTQGLDLSIERRLTFSADRKDLQIIERITTPAGQTERTTTVPLT